MTKRTSRDEIWHCALQCALIGETFELDRVHKLVSSDVSRRTVRDVLNTMVEYEWLSKEKPQSHEWLPGPRIDTARLPQEDQPTPSSPTHYSETHISSVDSLSEGDVYTAEVDRFSSSDNAVISVENNQLSHNHINLGPIDKKAKNQTVQFEYMGGVWGLCLNKTYTDEQYRPRQNQSDSASSRSSNSGNLDSIARGVMSRTQQKKNSKKSVSDDWESRKQEYLSNVNDTYD